MQTATIELTTACNFDCRFCPFHNPLKPAFMTSVALTQRLQQITASDCDEVILTGGEPTLHPKWLEVVQTLSGQHGRLTNLETNAVTFSVEGMAEKAAQIGLDTATVLWLSHDPGVFNSLIDVNATLGQVEHGLENLHNAGLDVIPNILIGEWNVQSLAENIDYLVKQWPSFSTIQFSLLELKSTVRSGLTMAIPLSDIAAGLKQALAYCEQKSLRAVLREGQLLPPCQANGLEHYTALFIRQATDDGRLAAREHKHVEDCQECSLKSHCPGPNIFYYRHFPQESVNALSLEKAKKWRPLIDLLTAPEEGEYEASLSSLKENRSHQTLVLRINSACNMACLHCWIEQSRGDTPTETLKDRIREAVQAGYNEVAFSGGEPTLRQDMVELIRYAREQDSKLTLELQTNAVKCDDLAFCQELKAAGVDRAFVSLLSPNKELFNRITCYRGKDDGFERVKLGIQNLARVGIRTTINFVINSLNYKSLPAFVDFFHLELDKCPDNPLWLNICCAQPINRRVMKSGNIVPRFLDLKPYLSKALKKSYYYSIEVSGLNSISGFPHCVLSGHLHLINEAEKMEGTAMEEIFAKPACCEGCKRQQKCLGIRRNYLAIYGDSEFY